MTGLFGANAVRSPLSDVPSSKARNAQQLEAIIENALLPDKFDNARAVASTPCALSPTRPASWPRCARSCSSRIPSGSVLNVLNAGGDHQRRRLRRGRPTATSCAASCSSSCRSSPRRRSRPTRPTSIWPSWRASSAWRCCPLGDNAETVLRYMHPIAREPRLHGRDQA